MRAPNALKIFMHLVQHVIKMPEYFQEFYILAWSLGGVALKLPYHCLIGNSFNAILPKLQDKI
jgi:hypothetical protein